MAGHSQFKNIMHRKGAQDAKRAKIFTKLIREIQVAAQLGGGDVDSNPRLRAAILGARAANMPKDNVERAIKKGTGEDKDTTYTEMRYEGYGPGGVAFIVEALTDNRNRTASEVRALFNRHGGSMGETGSVSFGFDHVGSLVYGSHVSEEDLFEVVLGGGGDDIEKTTDGFQIWVAREGWLSLREALEKKFGEPLEASVMWRPKTTVALPAAKRDSLQKMLDAFEDNDDVQAVWHNAVLADEESAETPA